MNGQLDPYVSALIYYVLSKIDEPDHLLAVVCKQTKGIFCCSCLAWNCDSEAFRRHKRYCDEDDEEGEERRMRVMGWMMRRWKG